MEGKGKRSSDKRARQQEKREPKKPRKKKNEITRTQTMKHLPNEANKKREKKVPFKTKETEKVFSQAVFSQAIRKRGERNGLPFFSIVLFV